MDCEMDPVELKSDELGCPRCDTQLVKGNVLYFVNEVKIGAFDGLLCEICRYGLLSERGYDESGRKLEEWHALHNVVKSDTHEADPKIDNMSKFI